MVKIKGLKGIRPKPDLADKIASRPYDVLNSEEARIEVKGNPYSFLHWSNRKSICPKISIIMMKKCI